MKLLPFALLTVLSLTFAGLTAKEKAVYRTWEQASVEQSNIQLKLAHSERLNEFTEAVLRHMAVDSQTDPALAELLKQRHIRVIVRNSEPTKAAHGTEATPASTNTPTQTPASPAPATPDVPAQTAPGSTLSHP